MDMANSENFKKYPRVRFGEKGFPFLLSQIPQPPKELYFRGKHPSELENLPKIAVVGPRMHSPYGKRVAEAIAGKLAQAGIVVVSGMAIGIDSVSHRAAIEAGGQTIAIVGSGIDESVVYPRSNKSFAKEIEKHGYVASEFDPFSRPETFFFPQRNRVVSGLSLGVVIIEAREKSGALITANLALEQNREVFAVPGSIYSETSKGTNNLIKQGAKCVSSAEEILEELNLENNLKQIEMPIASNGIEKKILAAIIDKGGESMHIDAIVEKTKLSASQVSSAIMAMELTDKIKNLGANRFVIR